mmetsp:Transcript_11143/g.26776  ORF Transcript_11143/g.26776 Transcript_11143/m.26776 type:complete len:140 (+) Transcript_11143:1500-1919(+)
MRVRGRRGLRNQVDLPQHQGSEEGVFGGAVVERVGQWHRVRSGAQTLSESYNSWKNKRNETVVATGGPVHGERPSLCSPHPSEATVLSGIVQAARDKNSLEHQAICVGVLPGGPARQHRVWSRGEKSKRNRRDVERTKR